MLQIKYNHNQTITLAKNKQTNHSKAQNHNPHILAEVTKYPNFHQKIIIK